MNRIFQILNLLGIVALAVLCVVQWNVNRSQNLHLIALEKIRQTQEQQLADSRQAIQGSVLDLDDFRASLEKSADELKQAEGKVAALTLEQGRLTTQRDQLQATIDAQRSTLEKWAAAVAQRDESLKDANFQLQKLVADRNDTIEKFNALAVKFNAAIAEVNKANEALDKMTKDRNDVVIKFNDLAAKYNQLVKQIESPKTTPTNTP